MSSSSAAENQTGIVVGKLPDGREVRRFSLENASGMSISILDYGATLESVRVPDPHHGTCELTLGFDELPGWIVNGGYLGATVGRFANRIANGKFSISGKSYRLETNDTPNGVPCHLHGGSTGFDRVLWAGRRIPQGVELRYHSADGEQGYPGNLGVTVRYQLSDDNQITWEVEATTDAPTIVNLVQHTYWNLSGELGSSMLDHELSVRASNFLPTDLGMIPTGGLQAVDGTPMDFRSPHPLGQRIDQDFPPLKVAGGYDHCWVLDRNDPGEPAARLRDPRSGRVMEVFTDQPGIQVYSGNFLDGSLIGRGGVPIRWRSGLCLETQGFPNSPNEPAFPSSVLLPGATYRHRTRYRFQTAVPFHQSTAVTRSNP